MSFFEDKTDEFIRVFEERKEKIRCFPGCMNLELWRDTNETNVFFTYSIWNSEEDLNHYRYSSFFKETWGITRALFKHKAEAWSLRKQSTTGKV